MMDHPKVTIGLLCYNAEHTIARAIKSAQAQDWNNLEIVIIDDVSSDKSVSVIENIAQHDPRIHLFQNERNGGPAYSRNQVLKHATGRYICFFDDDDISDPRRIGTQYEALKNAERIYDTEKIACYASGRRLYPNGYEMEIEAIGSRDRVPHGPEVASYLLHFERQAKWFYGGGTPTCALMIRRDVLIDIGGFDVGLRRVEDVDMAIRLAISGGYFVGTKDVLYTQYATHAADKSPKKNLQAEQYLAQKYKAFLDQNGLFEYAWYWPQLRYAHFTKNYYLFLKTFLMLFWRYPIKASRQFITNGIRRLVHEKKMKK